MTSLTNDEHVSESECMKFWHSHDEVFAEFDTA